MKKKKKKISTSDSFIQSYLQVKSCQILYGCGSLVVKVFDYRMEGYEFEYHLHQTVPYPSIAQLLEMI